MKKYMLLSFLGISAFSLPLSADLKEKELASAIKRMDKNGLESLLNTGNLNEENKKHWLTVAKRNTKLYKNSIHLTKSGWDCATFITGLVGASSTLSALGYSLSALGAGLLVSSLASLHDEEAEFPEGLTVEDFNRTKDLSKLGLKVGLGGTVVSAAGLIGSLYLVRKGWRCTTAQNLLNRAREIETLIENTPATKQ
ncbi:hypothetical protein H0X06_04995 [Candidatus Dependentiae bacterium]|nr:hypothetical protein [Candidatus Dependentiae bacterium]